MANEFLQETFGGEALTFEQFNEKLNGASLINNTDGSYVPKADYDNLNTQYTALQADNEKYKDYEPDWKEQLEKAKSDGAAELAAYKFDVAMSKALADARVADEKSIRANLDFDKIKAAEDGTLTGLSEQLEKLKTDKPFLFLAPEQPKLSLGGSTPGIKVSGISGIKGAVEKFYSNK